LQHSIVADNLPVKVSGLDRALQMNDSPVIRVKRFAYMADLVSASTVSRPNFSRIIDYLADLQQLPGTPPETAQLGPKCRKLVRTRWFYMVDTL
jgi:hypothetical protein